MLQCEAVGLRDKMSEVKSWQKTQVQPPAGGGGVTEAAAGGETLAAESAGWGWIGCGTRGELRVTRGFSLGCLGRWAIETGCRGSHWVSEGKSVCPMLRVWRPWDIQGMFMLSQPEAQGIRPVPTQAPA